jgi:hypothetical protein
MSVASSPSVAQNSTRGMSRLITMNNRPEPDPARARELCAHLEAGDIIFFPSTPFAFPDDDIAFLLGRKQTGAAFHKNIAYRPLTDRVTGLDESAGPDKDRLRAILRAYSQRSAQFLDDFFSPYAGKWKLDFASFRPLEERGRPARLRARNDLPHVDAFPTRPTNGDRILRLFTNLNPAQNRIWITSQTFDVLAPRFAKTIGFRDAYSSNKFMRSFRHLLSRLGLRSANRSPYDDFMHRCHNAMKENAEFQRSCAKQRWEFPPHSTWLVFTDFVSHAVLEGQYAMEQTFIVYRRAMVRPELSPASILEELAGYPLTIPA